MSEQVSTGLVVRVVGSPEEVRIFLKQLSHLREVVDMSPLKPDFEAPGRARAYATLGRSLR